MYNEPEIKQCAICGRSGIYTGPADLIATCDTHYEWHWAYQPWLVAEYLGIRSNKPEMKCAYCDKLLTNEEIMAINVHHFAICCAEHLFMAGVFQIGSAKEVLKKYPQVKTKDDFDIHCRMYFRQQHENREK